LQVAAAVAQVKPLAVENLLVAVAEQADFYTQKIKPFQQMPLSQLVAAVLPQIALLIMEAILFLAE
jgi:hypothetical protein